MFGDFENGDSLIQGIEGNGFDGLLLLVGYLLHDTCVLGREHCCGRDEHYSA